MFTPGEIIKRGSREPNFADVFVLTPTNAITPIEYTFNQQFVLYRDYLAHFKAEIRWDLRL